MGIKQNPATPATLGELESWFSVSRVQRFADHPSPVDFYLWNARVTKAFLEDIQHLEVLFRNLVDGLLSENWGTQWLLNHRTPNTPGGLNCNRLDMKAISRAVKRAGGPEAPSGKVISELTLDFWFHLLDARHGPTIHPKIHTGMGHRHSIKELRSQFEVVYELRNRCAHHEPLALNDSENERAYVEAALESIKNVTPWINPDASKWIVGNSRVRSLYDQRPK